MRRSFSCSSLAQGAIAAGLLCGIALAPPASAADLSLTVSPSAVGLSNAPDFSFTGVRTSDFASINLTFTGANTSTFTEIGYLPLASLDPGNFTPPGLNGSAGATPYGMYIQFSATGSLTTTGTFAFGSFSTLAFTLMGDPGFDSSFNHFDATHQSFCVGCGNDILLATGTLLPGGTNSVSLANANTASPLPAAFVDLLFNSTSSAFWVSPNTPFSVALTTQFSNTATVTNQYTTSLPAGVDAVVTIGTTGNVGGSGTGQFAAVPEPSSALVLGMGLAALGLGVRRRNA